MAPRAVACVVVVALAGSACGGYDEAHGDAACRRQRA